MKRTICRHCQQEQFCYKVNTTNGDEYFCCSLCDARASFRAPQFFERVFRFFEKILRKKSVTEQAIEKNTSEAWWGAFSLAEYGSPEREFYRKKMIECAEMENTVNGWYCAYCATKDGSEELFLLRKKVLECAEKEGTVAGWIKAHHSTIFGSQEQKLCRQKIDSFKKTLIKKTGQSPMI